MGAVTVLMVLVVLAGIAAAVVRTNQQAHHTTAQDVLALRAQSAARAGIEWGLYQVFQSGNWADCTTAPRSQTLTFGMTVTVTCTSADYREGLDDAGAVRSLRSYTVDAVACNGSSGSCPDNASAGRLGYVERRRQVQATS